MHTKTMSGMQPYSNLSGISAVQAFEIGDRYIDIRFKDGTVYHYSYVIPGRASVEDMKRLALVGLGLNTYINQHVRRKYATRLS